MNKKRICKTVFIIISIIIAGILYSCSFNKKPRIMTLTQDESKTSEVLQNKETSDVNTQTQLKNQEIQSGETDNEGLPQNSNQVLNSTDMENSTEEMGTLDDQKAEKSIFVHVCGAVKKPDVYKLKEGTRIVEAIRLAGGLTKNAAGDLINQAAILTDGQQLYIPTVNEAGDSGRNNSTSSGTIQSDKVNINTANEEELMTLTGIGEAKAKSIIDYRQANGGFKNIEDIKNIDGIKESVFNKISDKITVN